MAAHLCGTSCHMTGPSACPVRACSLYGILYALKAGQGADGEPIGQKEVLKKVAAVNDCGVV